MIYWIPVSLSIPAWVPSLELVAWWLVVGDVVLVTTCVLFARERARKGRTPTPVFIGYMLLPVIWPLPAFLWARKLIKGGRA